MRIRIRSVVSVPALVIGLVASFPSGAFAYPAPAAGRSSLASLADLGQRAGVRPAPFGAQPRLEQRRSPGGGGGGGGHAGGAVVRSGGGPPGGGGGPQGGGGRVAVPRPPGSYPGGGYHGHTVVVAPGVYPYPYYYPYAYSSFYGGGYYNSYWYGGIGFGATWGPGWGYYGGYPYPYPAYGYPAYGGAGAFGRLRLQLDQRDAEVFIDGSYAGVVDDFDGKFQGLQLESGAHKVEVRKPGFESIFLDIRVTPDHTTTIKSQMTPTGGIEVAPPK